MLCIFHQLETCFTYFFRFEIAKSYFSIKKHYRKMFSELPKSAENSRNTPLYDPRDIGVKRQFSALKDRHLLKLLRSTPSSIDSPRTPTRTRRGTSSTRRTERSRTNEYRGRTRGRSPGSHSPVGSRRVSSARGWIGWRRVTPPTSFSRGTAIASTRRRRYGLWRRCGRCRGRSRNGARRCEETCDVNAALASLGSLAS